MRLFANYSANYVEGLYARIAALEQELEQAKADRNRAAMDARNPLLTRLAALEAEAKQAREDEAWFSRQHEATVYKVVLGWLVECDGGRVESGAIADGIRALRANVEGGAR